MQTLVRPRPARLLAFAAVLAAPAAHAAGDEIFHSGFEAALLFPDEPATGEDVGIRAWSGVASERTSALYAGSGADSPVRYGECLAACTTAANWHFATLGSYGSPGLGGGPRLALDGSGHPRVVWYAQSTIGGDGTLYYGECDAASCATAGAWNIQPLLSFTGGDSMSLLARGAFALDPSGHPRLLLQDLGSGTYYGQCDAGCTAYANWTFSSFATISAIADLKFTADGHPRVAFESAAPNIIDGEDLYYAACDSACANEANWSGVTLLTINANLVTEPFALALDAQDQPRIALYYDVANANELSYLWCDSSCSVAGSGTWQAYSTGLPKYSGYKGVAIAVDAADVPHLAYGGSPDGVSDDAVVVADCIQACDSSPQWQWREVATTQDIPDAPPDPCLTGQSFWQLGTSPDLALVPQAQIVFGTYSYFSCVTGHDSGGNPIYTFSTMDGPVGYAQP